jgi:hypothetical protein
VGSLAKRPARPGRVHDRALLIQGGTKMTTVGLIQMASFLRRNGVEALQPGQAVRIRIGEGPKGLQVTDIRLS